MGEGGIACAQDPVIAELDPQLIGEGLPDVDFGNDPEALFLEGFDCALKNLVEAACNDF